MTAKIFSPFLFLCIFVSTVGQAQEIEGEKAGEQVVQPKIDRTKVKVPKIRSTDIEIGAYTGIYSVEDFGSNKVKGYRLAFHATEDIFLEGTMGETTVSDDAYRNFLPGGLFPTPQEKLTYYNVSVGLNLFPGEVFITKNYAFASAVYVVLGLGNTEFIKENHSTVSFGLGFRLLATDWLSFHFDMKDHMFESDVTGTRKSTHNFELIGSLAFFF
jgi:outer membrane beta-barrel protein